MNTLIELAKSRHSVRRFQKSEVEENKMNVILEAGRIAPTAANQQPCKFIVLKGDELKHLEGTCNYYQAPLVIVVCSDKNITWKRPYDGRSMIDIDATIATDHMMLCAEDLDLSSCWITYFNPSILIKNLNLPSNLVPINILAIGYSLEPEKSLDRYNSDRKSLSTIVHFSKF